MRSNPLKTALRQASRERAVTGTDNFLTIVLCAFAKPPVAPGRGARLSIGPAFPGHYRLDCLHASTSRRSNPNENKMTKQSQFPTTRFDPVYYAAFSDRRGRQIAQGHSGSWPSKRIVHRPTKTLDTLAILKGETAKTGITLDEREKK